MYPRDSLARSQNITIDNSSDDDNGIVSAVDQNTGDSKSKQKDATEQVSAIDGSVTLPPRTYLEMLSPIHHFKEDKTTFYQYFRRPFVLFSFPNVVIVSFSYSLSPLLSTFTN